MDDQRKTTFEYVAQEGHVGRTARMLDETQPLKPNQRTDIVERFKAFIADHEYTQATVAREISAGRSTISDVLRGNQTGKKADEWLAKIHNWMELTARRHDIVRSREFVKHSVSREIIDVAKIVAETLQLGVVFGPARIGKTMTLKALEGEQQFGDPVLIRVDETTTRPFALCRAICERFKLSTSGTFDRVFRRLVNRLESTKRVLFLDEADRLGYKAIESLRDLHDRTGCGILFCGKPTIYEHLGLRSIGDFSERFDQLAGRIAICRDLTERTRDDENHPGEKLYSLSDIRKMIAQSGLTFKLTPDAEKWLQDRASTLGLGGIGRAMVNVYLAAKVAYTTGQFVITVDHLEDVDKLAMGHEDASRIMEIVAESSGMRKTV